MTQRQPLPPKKPSSLPLTELSQGFLVWGILWIVSVATAQTVYRCGDQYSASPSCNGAIISSVEDARNDRQAQAQKAQTLHAQQEADTLEKNRLKAEQHVQRNAAPPLTVKRDTRITNPADNTSPLPSSHGQHRKPASPYFTAKDNTPKPTKPKAEEKGASSKAAP